MDSLGDLRVRAALFSGNARGKVIAVNAAMRRDFSGSNAASVWTEGALSDGRGNLLGLRRAEQALTDRTTI
jgi:hypothetical protein